MIVLDSLIYFYMALCLVCIIIGFAIYYEYKDMKKRIRDRDSLKRFFDCKRIKELEEK